MVIEGSHIRKSGRGDQIENIHAGTMGRSNEGGGYFPLVFLSKRKLKSCWEIEEVCLFGKGDGKELMS